MRRTIQPKTLTTELPDYQGIRLQDAAPVLGFTVGTLRKKCATGKQPGAFKTSVTSGDWRIPFGVLRPLIAARQSA